MDDLSQKIGLPVTPDLIQDMLEYGIINNTEYEKLMTSCIESKCDESDDNVENDDNDEKGESIASFQPGETEVHNEDGTITRTIRSIDNEGRKIQTVRKIKIVKRQKKVLKRVMDRRRIQKFGQCADKSQGPEPGVTSVGDLVDFEKPSSEKEESKKEKKWPKLANRGGVIKCRKCGESGHWTKDCHMTDQNLKLVNDMNKLVEETSSTPSTPSSNKYVAPSRRNNRTTEVRNNNASSPKTNIRIANLDEEATNDDLRALCKPFGNIKSARVITDRETKKSRGFAFVEYESEESAESAIKTLNGYAYGSLILGVSLAQPKKK